MSMGVIFSLIKIKILYLAVKHFCLSTILIFIFLGGAVYCLLNSDSDYNVIHSHPNSLWSAVYYVNRGDPDPNVDYGGSMGYMQVANVEKSHRGYILTQNASLTLPYFDEQSVSLVFDVTISLL